MKTLIKKLGQVLDSELDQEQYMIAGNAFGKKSLFLYKPHARNPSFVARVPQTEEGDEQCLREFNMLRYFAAQNFIGLIAPKGLAVKELLGKTYYFQEVVAFDSLLGKISLVRKNPPAKSLELATSALIAIYKKTKKANAYDDSSFSLCFQHGDFWLGNIGLASDNLVLLDLEFAVDDGFPLYDLLHFGLYYQVVRGNIGKVGNKQLEMKKEEDGRVFTPSANMVKYLLLENNKLSVLMRKSIIRYLKECNITQKDGLFLIKKYFEEDRGIRGLEKNWENHIFV